MTFVIRGLPSLAPSEIFSGLRFDFCFSCTDFFDFLLAFLCLPCSSALRNLVLSSPCLRDSVVGVGNSYSSVILIDTRAYGSALAGVRYCLHVWIIAQSFGPCSTMDELYEIFPVGIVAGGALFAPPGPELGIFTKYP